MKYTLAFFTLLLLSLTGAAQFNEDSLKHFRVLPNDTDPLIPTFGSDDHQVFLNPTSTSTNTLLLHLVGSGDTTGSTTLFPSLAANNGFHCINLAYRNGVSAQNACADIPDTDCHLNWRKEIIEGINYSPYIFVNTTGSIYNRLLKLLQFLAVNNPTQNWGQYYSVNTIHWEKIIISGHSQGGGHAAVIGISQPLQRVIMFGSPNDYIDTLNVNAPWSSLPHIVPDSNYYSFNSLNDEIVNYTKQYNHGQSLGQGNHGDTVCVESNTFPYHNSRQLYTTLDAPSGFPIQLTHNLMIRDHETPMDQLGAAVFTCAWLYLLGIDCSEVVGINEIPLDHTPKKLVKIVNTMGVQTEERPTTLLIYIYSDGTTEKVYKID